MAYKKLAYKKLLVSKEVKRLSQARQELINIDKKLRAHPDYIEEERLRERASEIKAKLPARLVRRPHKVVIGRSWVSRRFG